MANLLAELAGRRSGRPRTGLGGRPRPIRAVIGNRRRLGFVLSNSSVLHAVLPLYFQYKTLPRFRLIAAKEINAAAASLCGVELVRMLFVKAVEPDGEPAVDFAMLLSVVHTNRYGAVWIVKNSVDG